MTLNEVAVREEVNQGIRMVRRNKKWRPAERLNERLNSMPLWKRCLSILFFCSLWLGYLAFGGVIFNRLEGDAEFVRTARYETWGDSICALQQEDGVADEEKARLQSLLENANPDPSMRFQNQMTRLRERLAAAQAENSTNSTNKRRMLAEDTGDENEDEDEDAAPEGEEEDTDSDADDADLEQWTLFGAMWFSWTLITSISYGSYAPNSVAGQWMVIIYGFVGIAIEGRACSIP